MFQFILFDLDGTLTDPKEGITKSIQYALEKLGIKEADLEQLTHFIGPPLKEQFMETYQLTEEKAELAIEKYRERFQVKGLYENFVYGGIEELLQALQDSGKRLGIASSKPQVFVVEILKHFKLYDYFEVVVGSELDGTRTNKSEVVEEALKQFKIKSEELKGTVLVGDRRHDVEGAKKQGIASIGVSYGYGGRPELEQAGADIIVSSVTELKKVLVD